MVTLCRAYTSEDAAHATVERLLAAGVPGEGIHVLMGAAIHDARDVPVGSFAGATRPDEEAVGSYGGVRRSGRAAMGGFAGETRGQRRGGFADVDRETVATYPEDVEHVRIASHHDLRRMLLDAGLDAASAESDVEALHHGRVLVLVRSDTAGDELAAVLDA